MFFLGAIIALIDVRKLVEKWVANNPNKASIYIEAGEQVERVNGKLIYSADIGSMYEYKLHGKSLIVAVPADYPFKFIRGRRKIEVRAGQALSAYQLKDIQRKAKSRAEVEKGIFTQAIAEPVDLVETGNKQGAYDLNALIKGQVAVELVKSLFGKKVSTWLIVLIIAGVAAIGFFFYNNFLKPEVPPEQPPMEQQYKTIEEAIKGTQ